MKRLAILVLGAIAVIVASSLQSADPPNSAKRTRLTSLMRMKLDKSKEILEGLTLEDHDKVARNARSLKLLSLESGWNVIQTAEYATQSKDFRRACDLIAEAAAEKDISRATLGYVTLTVRCIECHSYMRKHKIELTKLHHSTPDSEPASQ